VELFVVAGLMNAAVGEKDPAVMDIAKARAMPDDDFLITGNLDIQFEHIHSHGDGCMTESLFGAFRHFTRSASVGENHGVSTSKKGSLRGVTILPVLQESETKHLFNSISSWNLLRTGDHRQELSAAIPGGSREAFFPREEEERSAP